MLERTSQAAEEVRRLRPGVSFFGNSRALQPGAAVFVQSENRMWCVWVCVHITWKSPSYGYRGSVVLMRQVFLIGSCFYVSWFSPPHPFLSCLFKPNDLYHFLGRAQGKRWKLGSRSMNINKTFYTPSKGQAWHFFLPSPPLSQSFFLSAHHFHTVFHPSCDITPSSVNERSELYSTLTL